LTVNATPRRTRWRAANDSKGHAVENPESLRAMKGMSNSHANLVAVS
jgi:hypothetical protein